MADESLNIYDEIEIEDMTFDPNIQIYHYPCPCGDRFEIAIDDLRDGEEIAVCPSCSLMIRVIFDEVGYFLYFLPCEVIVSESLELTVIFVTRPIYPKTIMNKPLVRFRCKLEFEIEQQTIYIWNVCLV